MDAVVRVTGLGKRYPGAHEWAVKNVSVSFRRGEVYGLVGENGAGKTTLLRLLLGFLRPTEGRVEIGRGVRLGYVPERPAFPFGFTVREYLNLVGGAAGVGGGTLRKRVEDVLVEVDLVGKTSAGVGTLSRGMLQRLGIAQAILGDADFIVMDEPAGGLDPIGQKGIRDLITRINRRNRTVVFSSHYLAEIERVCHRVGIMHRGCLALDRDLDGLVRDHRERVEVELGVDAGTLDDDLSRLGLVYEIEGHRIRFVDLDDERYFAVMSLFARRGVRVMGLRPTGLLLEQVFLDVTASASGTAAGPRGERP